MRSPLIRIRSLSILLIPSFLLCAIACDKGGPGAGGDAKGKSEAPASRRAGVLVYGRGKDSVTLDPAEAQDGESSKVIDNLYETLVDFSKDPENPGRVVPLLATSWKESADRHSWTFQLRKGVKFHDGTTFDAKAAKLSFDHLLDPDAPTARPYRSNFLNIKSVEAKGEHELVFHLEQPSVVLVRNLAMFCSSIISPTALAKSGKHFSSQPVGTGPFRFGRWKKGQVVVLDRFEDWWGPKRGNIKTIVFSQIKDWASRREQLISGEIDMTDDIVFQDVESLRNAEHCEVQIRDGINVCYLSLNNTKAPFDDPRVRRAAAMAVDRDRIIKLGYHGQAVQARDLIPANIQGHAEVAPEHSIEQARKLLEQAGKTGIEVEFWVMNNPRPYLMQPDQVAQIIKESLQKAGFRVRIVKLDWATYLKRLGDGAHQLAIIGWSTDNADPDNFYSPLLSQAAIGGTNYSRFADDDFNAALQASKHAANWDERGRLFGRMQEILRRECPSVPLVYTRIGSAYLDRVTGFVRHPIKIYLGDTSVD